jgi:hypothetical protein
MNLQLLIPLLVCILAVAFLARKLSELYPTKPWVVALFRYSYGPRTDVANLTKIELYESGLQFVKWGVLFMSVLFSGGIVGRILYLEDWPPSFLMLSLLCAFMTGMGFLGGVYLLLRAAIRPRNWAPPNQR